MRPGWPNHAMKRCKRYLVLALAVLLLQTPAAYSFQEQGDFDHNRARLLSFLIRQQLTQNHFSRKAVDDELSRAAFDLYLKQLDFQKRFLLKKDVEKLSAFATRIDDEINTGRIELPEVAANLLRERIPLAQKMVREILAAEISFNKREFLETDPEKIDFVATEAQLKERWRLIVKYQVLNRYLNLVEEQEALPAKERKPQEQLRKEAQERVLKSQEEFFNRLLEEKLQDHYDRYFNAVARAFDPHTGYMPPTLKEDFDIDMRGSLEGIGATLREEDGYIKVVQVMAGSPAQRQGQLQAEDIILKVAEGDGEFVDITDTRIRDAVRLIRGKKGTVVRLAVRKPDGSQLTVPIVRDVVQIEESFVKSTTFSPEGGGQNYGYLKIPTFYRDFQEVRNGGTGRNSTDDVRNELKALKSKNIQGLIIDLRNNGGGALTDAISIAGLFIDRGPVVQVKDMEGRIQVLHDDQPGSVYDGPLVVLVNRFSASASEILAGALQDYGRAVIIGSDHTHGKGTVQAVVDLDRSLFFPNMEKYKPLGALKVTIQKFYRVSGDSTQYRGVIPDIVLPDRMEHLKTGEKHLDYSLPWDRVPASDFRQPDGLERKVAALRSRSDQRVREDGKFKEIRSDAEKARERMEKTLQSLHIDDMRKERETARKLAGGDLSPHGTTPMMEAEGEKPENPAKDWREELATDPYVTEAMFLLGDIVAFRTSPKSLEGVAGGGKR